MILFVDINDVCRAALAAAYCGRKLQQEAEHAGVYGQEGTPASELVQSAAQAVGLDLSGHTAQPLTEETMQRAQAIYGMTAAITEHLRADYPAYADKMTALEIADPFGQGREEYDRCVQAIRDALEAAL